VSLDGQGTKWRRNITVIFNRLSRAHERYRQRIYDDIYSEREREREFTFANDNVTMH